MFVIVVIYLKAADFWGAINRLSAWKANTCFPVHQWNHNIVKHNVDSCGNTHGGTWWGLLALRAETCSVITAFAKLQAEDTTTQSSI